jgi:hypothetical protein
MNDHVRLPHGHRGHDVGRQEIADLLSRGDRAGGVTKGRTGPDDELLE